MYNMYVKGHANTNFPWWSRFTYDLLTLAAIPNTHWTGTEHGNWHRFVIVNHFNKFVQNFPQTPDKKKGAINVNFFFIDLMSIQNWVSHQVLVFYFAELNLSSFFLQERIEIELLGIKANHKNVRTNESATPKYGSDEGAINHKNRSKRNTVILVVHFHRRTLLCFAFISSNSIVLCDFRVSSLRIFVCLEKFERLNPIKRIKVNAFEKKKPINNWHSHIWRKNWIRNTYTAITIDERDRFGNLSFSQFN